MLAVAAAKAVAAAAMGTVVVWCGVRVAERDKTTHSAALEARKGKGKGKDVCMSWALYLPKDLTATPNAGTRQGQVK